MEGKRRKELLRFSGSRKDAKDRKARKGENVINRGENLINRLKITVIGLYLYHGQPVSERFGFPAGYSQID